MIKSEKILVMFVALLGMFSVVTSLLILMNRDRPKEYSFLFFMPLAYLSIVFVLAKWHTLLFRSWSITLIAAVYCVKYVLTPLVMNLDGYITVLPQKNDSRKYINEAILLYVYEMIVIMLVMLYIISCYGKKLYEYVPVKERWQKRGLYKRMMFAFAIVCLGIVTVYPTLKQNFHMIWQMNTYVKPNISLRSWRTFGENSDVPFGLIDTFLMYVWYNLQLIIPVIFIEKIFYSSSMRRGYKWLATLAVCVVSLLFFTDNNSNTIMVAVSLFLLAFMLYPDKAKKVALPIICVIALGAAFFLVEKQHVTGQTGGVMSSLFNAYFGGIDNLAVAIHVRSKIMPVKGIGLFLEDMCAMLPGMDRVPDIGMQAHKLFNLNFWGIKDRTDQLLPAVGSGLIYFGFLLAPVIPAIMAYLVLLCERMAVKTSDIKVRGLFLFGIVAISLLMANNNLLTIGGFIKTYFLNYILILLVYRKIRLHDNGRKLGEETWK